ncbi:MAG: MATE family efflux transporter [Lysobacterales bacterium]
MSQTVQAAVPSRRDVFARAWPIVLANISVPVLGLVDTAVIGHLGEVAALGAIALGTLLFNFVFWAFGFLRMGTTGFVARADGAGAGAEVQAVLARALWLAGGLGLALLLLQWPIIELSLWLLGGSPATEALARDYAYARIWGAPASLALFALMGTLVGLGRSDKLLQLQLLLNGLNLLLNVLLAMGLGWGVFGIGVGTALAEWLTVVCGLWLLHQLLGGAGQAWRWRWRSLGGWSSMRPMLLANVDILIRTLALLACFAWFTHQGALFGDTVLAANHILLQLISFAAFFLDGFAFAAEGWVGRAVGARQRQLFDAVLWRTSELALWTALALALLAWFWGDWAVSLLTNLPSVQAQASQQLLAVSAYILLSVAAFQLDGVFIGAGWTRAMRWASLLSAAAFGVCWSLLQPWGNAGLWWAFVLYVLCRALALWLWLPGLRREIAVVSSP